MPCTPSANLQLDNDAATAELVKESMHVDAALKQRNIVAETCCHQLVSELVVAWGYLGHTSK